MIDTRRKKLLIAARVLMLLSLAFQILIVIANWWMFGSRLSCNHLIFWAEWIACVQGDLDVVISMMGGCVLFWVVAGIGALLGRFLPPYISVIVPLGMAAVAIWFVLENFNLPESIPRLAYTFVFTIAFGLVAILLAGPAVGGRMGGFSRRG